MLKRSRFHRKPSNPKASYSRGSSPCTALGEDKSSSSYRATPQLSIQARRVPPAPGIKPTFTPG